MLSTNNDRVTIRIGHLPILDHLILGVAEKNDNGFYKNFSLQTKQFQNWDAISDSLIANDIDGAFLMFPLALDVYRKHKDISLVLLGHREGQVLVVAPNIKEIADLKDKTIHIPHRFSTHYILLAQVLKSVGLDVRSDVRLKVGYDDIRSVVETLASKATDGFIIAEPLGTEARRRKKGHIISLSRDVLAHHIDCVLVIKTELLKNHREAVAELIDSLVKAGMFINAYPRQAAEIGERCLGWSKKLLLESLTHDSGHILYWDLLPRTEDLNVLQEIAVHDLNLWPDVINLDRFVDASFAQQAYRDWAIDLRRERGDKGEARMLPGSFGEIMSRLKNLFCDAIPYIGVRFIASGEKFPKNMLVVESLDDVLIEHALGGVEYLIKPSDMPSFKGMALFSSRTDIVPDRVLLRLSKMSASIVYQALNFGELSQDFPTLVNFEEALQSPHSFIIFQREEDIFCVMRYEVFRFLPLLLTVFALPTIEK